MTLGNSDAPLKKILEEVKSTSEFIVRREPFGSLIYDTSTEDYMAFDEIATLLFEESTRLNVNKVFETSLAGKLSWTSFQTFVRLCKSIGLIGEDGRFKGKFINQKAFPRSDSYLSAPTLVKIALTDKLEVVPEYDEMYKLTKRETKSELAPLTPELWDRLLKELADMGTFHIHLTLDPLQSKLLPHILIGAKKYKLKITLTTTATHLPRYLNELAPELKERVKELKVRIDGITEKSYQLTMGKPYLNRVTKNLKRLFEIFKDSYKVMEVVLITFNASELPSFIRFAETYEFSNISFKFPLTTSTSKLLSPKEVLNIAQALQRQQENTFINIDLFALPNPFESKLVYNGFGCPCGRQWMFISPYGEIYPGPCFVEEKEFLAGRFPRTSTQDAWHFSPAFQKLRELDNVDETCKKCEYFRTCRGGCRYRAWKLKGKLEVRDPFCPLFPTYT